MTIADFLRSRARLLVSVPPLNTVGRAATCDEVWILSCRVSDQVGQFRLPKDAVNERDFVVVSKGV